VTLDQAKQMILEGAKFGDVYPILLEDSPHPMRETKELREWYTATPNVPARVEPAKRDSIPAQTFDVLPTKNGQHKPKATQTGKFCPDCGGCRIVRTGSCETCQDCGRNEGCG
jgi:hypothetical protein